MKNPSLLLIPLSVAAVGLGVYNNGAVSNESSPVPAEAKPAGKTEVRVQVAPQAVLPEITPPVVLAAPEPVVEKKIPQVVVTRLYQEPAVMPQPQIVAEHHTTALLPAMVAPIALPTPPVSAAFEGYAAIDLAQQSRGAQRTALLRQGIEFLLEEDIEEALDAADSLQDELDHDIAVAVILHDVALESPEEAAEILLTRIPLETVERLQEYPALQPMMSNLSLGSYEKPADIVEMSRSISSDTSMNMSWSSSISDGDKRSAAFSGLMAEWASRDQNAAREWAESTSDTSVSERQREIELPTDFLPPGKVERPVIPPGVR